MHKIETFMYNGKPAWHGLGERLADEEVYDMEIGIRRAGMDWEVGLDQLQLADGRQVDRFAVVRRSDNKILGNVGPKYTPLQNRHAFKFFNPFLEAKCAKLHTAGSLDGGKVIFVLAHVTGSRQEVVAGDRVDQFILLSSSHDGTQAVRVGFTPVRVVCANTLAMAHGDAASKLIRIRHTKSVHDNLDAIRDVMDTARAEFSATMEQYRKLANINVNQHDVRKYVKLVLGIEEKTPLNEIPGRTRNLLLAMEELSVKGTGVNIPGVSGTLWGAYNGVTEMLAYGRGKDREKRLESLWFGSAAELNRKAMEIALQMAS